MVSFLTFGILACCFCLRGMIRFYQGMIERVRCRGQSTESAARVVLVDPYSTGAMLAPELDLRGYAVIALWTKEPAGWFEGSILLLLGLVEREAKGKATIFAILGQ